MIVIAMPSKVLIELANKILRSRLSNFFPEGLVWEFAGLSRSLAMEAILRGVKNEQEFWKKGEEDASRVLRFVDSNSVVLDVGCGIGRVMKFVSPYCKEVHGIDKSRLLLRIAKRELQGLKNCFLYREVDGKLSIFKFDLVYSFYVLQHMEKEDAYLYLGRIRDVLKPGGIVYLQFPDFTSDHYFSLFEEYALKGLRFAERVRFYTYPEIKKCLNVLGCKFWSMKATAPTYLL
jgi:SAM-dependent methyltransferase